MLQLSVPVALAYLPLGTALGILVVKTGLAWFWAPLSAMLIYAGSAEFLAVGLIATGTGLAQTAITAAVVNFRHVFYGFSFPMRSIRHPIAKAYGVWGLTDEIYAIVSSRLGRDLRGASVTALQLLCQTYWVSGALAGALVGRLLPDRVVGFGFALTAMFVILLVDAVREGTSHFQVVGTVVSILVAVTAEGLWSGSFLVVGLGCFVGLVVARWFATPEQGREALA